MTQFNHVDSSQLSTQSLRCALLVACKNNDKTAALVVKTCNMLQEKSHEM